MASILVAPTAKRNLRRLIATHSLPPDTRDRVRNRILPLAEVPLMGPGLEGQWHGLRFILGPWSWMLIVYAFDSERDEVHILSIEDARMATSPTSAR